MSSSSDVKPPIGGGAPSSPPPPPPPPPPEGPAGSSSGCTAAAMSNAARRRNRTNYRCSKCGQPKRGHVCPYQPRIVRAEGETAPETRTVACQVEIDARLVIRHLQLDAQGLPESYGESSAAMAASASSAAGSSSSSSSNNNGVQPMNVVSGGAVSPPVVSPPMTQAAHKVVHPLPALHAPTGLTSMPDPQPMMY